MPRKRATAEAPVPTNLSLPARERRALEYMAGEAMVPLTVYVARLIVSDLDRHGVSLYDKRFDPPKEESAPRQELHWVGPDRNVPAVTEQPTRVWCLPGDHDRTCTLPFAPIHGFNAWSLDVGHDWAMRGPGRCLRYSPGGSDHKGAWLLCEWEEPKEKGK